MNSIDKDFFKRVKEISKGVKLTILLFILIAKFSYIFNMLNILKLLVFDQNINDSAYALKLILSILCILFFTSMLNIVLNMEIFSYIDIGKFKISNILMHIKNDFKRLFITGLIYLFVNVVFIRSMVIGYMAYIFFEFSFLYVSYLLLLYPDDSVIGVFKRSLELTSRKKIKFLTFHFYYYWSVYLVSIIFFVGTMISFFMNMPNFSANTGNIPDFLYYLYLLLEFLFYFVPFIYNLFVSLLPKFLIVFFILYSINAPNLYVAYALFFKEQLQSKKIELI